MHLIFVCLNKPELPDYLRIAVERGRMSGWDVKVLSDRDLDGCINLLNFASDATHFAIGADPSVFQYPDRRFSMIRWLILRDYQWRVNNGKPILSVDNDVLVFAQPDALDSFTCDVACVSNHHSQMSPGTMLLSSVKVLERFVEFMHKWKDEKGTYGPDMGMWTRFLHLSGFRYEHLDFVRDMAIWDSNIGDTSNARFDSDGSVKRVVWASGKPHFIDVTNNEAIMCNCLHFCGRLRRLMPQYHERFK